MTHAGRTALAISTLVVTAWTGCNGLLGNSDAFFNTTDASLVDGSLNEGSPEGAPSDGAPPLDAVDGGIPDGPIPCDGGMLGDPHNCGSCGHDCRGACSPDGGCAPFILVSGENSPSQIALSDTSVFWNAGNNINYCPKTDCRAGSRLLTSPGPLSALAVSPTGVYWAPTTGGLFGCGGPMPGCCTTPGTILNGGSFVGALATDDAGVYWTDYVNDNVQGCPVVKGPCSLACAGMTPTVSASSVGAIAVALGTVYFTERPATPPSYLQSVPAAGGTVLTVATLDSISGPIASLSSTTFVINASATSAGPMVYEVALDGGQTGLGSIGAAVPLGLAVDSTSVYWTVGSTIWKSVIATQETLPIFDAGIGTPQGISVDDTAIYWADTASGDIWEWVK